MNYVIRELTLYRHFLLIDSPISFEFIANPTNYNKNMSDFSRVTGLDVCSRPPGCWRVDCWKLLPKEFQRNNPVFTMLLKYDADLLHEGEVVDVRYSDIDVGEGVAGVNGQLVQILPSTFQPVVNAVDSLRELNSDGFDSLGRSIGNADVNNVNGCNAIMDSVNALQTSNHADLGSVKTSVDALRGASLSKELFLFSSISYVNLIPISVSGSHPANYAFFSLPFFDTFINLRYSEGDGLWHENWVFVPRGVRFLLEIKRHSDSAGHYALFILTYPVNGVDVSKTYKYDVPDSFLYSVDCAVPSVLV